MTSVSVPSRGRVVTASPILRVGFNFVSVPSRGRVVTAVTTNALISALPESESANLKNLCTFQGTNFMNISANAVKMPGAGLQDFYGCMRSALTNNTNINIIYYHLDIFKTY